jgi:hypothetical protein
MATMKTTEERRANTDRVFKEIKDKEEQARLAKNDRLRQARENAEVDRRS